MRKNNITKIVLATLALGLSVSIIPSTVAWFTEPTKVVEPSILGRTEGAYFAGGDGSAENPYLITNAVHIYNLAWLQYYGQFNEMNGNTLTKQYYFEVLNDIDMDEMIIPPIGTSQYPFLGNFNGGNHLISNFRTTNIYTELVKKPFQATSLTNVNIVGFFGIVGTLDNQNYTYDTSTNKIINLGLQDFTIKTGTTQTLAGLAAGYVNGTIKGVAVNNGNIDLDNISHTPVDNQLTTNISDYGTIGYCKPDYRSTCKVRDVKYYDPTVSYAANVDGGNEWGGSIDMLGIFNDLNTVSSNGNRYKLPTSVDRYYDEDGNLTNTQVNSTTDNSYTPSGHASGNGGRWREKTDEENDIIASYNVWGSGAYLWLGGEKEIEHNNTDTTFTDHLYYDAPEFVIKDNANHYIGNNNTQINTANSQASATKFAWEDGYLRTIVNNTIYYLSANNNNLVLTTNKQTTFRFNNGKLTTGSGNNIKGLLYSNNNWTLSNFNQQSDEFRISYTSNNTTHNFSFNGNVLDITDADTATRWIKEGNNYYTTYDNQKYYAGLNGNSLTVATNPNRKFNLYNNNRLRAYGSNGRTYYYLRYSNGWSASTSTTNANMTFNYDMTGDYTAVQLENTGITLKVPTTTTTTERAKFTTKPTYIPLSWEDDERTIVGDKNTGYLVGGSRSASPYNDLRVSRYARSSLSKSSGTSGNSYADNQLQVVTRTANSNGFVRIKDSHNSQLNFSSGYNDLRNTYSSYKTEDELGFNKYASSRTAFGKVLEKDQTNLYGLHFMDASVGIDYLVNADKVHINAGDSEEANEYQNYQLPESSIDFNLKQKGYINFFAGSYYTQGSGNKTFFSLHQVFRDENQNITSIKELDKVYRNRDAALNPDYPYVYKYKNESVPSNADGDALFELSWITNPTMTNNVLYYFEIPANPGEYALGSVNGLDGAYLMYLDISAANRTVDITVVSEKYEIEIVEYEYPVGIDFMVFIPNSSETIEEIEGGDVACIIVPGNAKGIVTFSLTDSILTCGPPTSGTLTASFEGEGITIKDTSDNEIISNPQSEGKEIIERDTTYTFNNEDNSLTTEHDITTTYKDKNGTTINTTYENIVVSVEENLEVNPYLDTPEFIGLTQIISGFRYYSKEGVNVTYELTFNPLTDVYTITFTSDATVDVVIKVADINIPSKYHIRISNVSESVDITKNTMYSFTITV